MEYYGLAPDFPLSSQLVARSLEAARPKRLYFVAQPLMDVMVADAQESLKIISVGLKVFERQEIREGDSPDSCCSYRIAQEGLPLILPHLTKQRVQSGRPEFIELLRDRYLMLPHPNAAQASAPQANGAEPAAAEASAAAPAEGGAGWKPGSGKAAKEANAGQRKPPIADAELIRQVCAFDVCEGVDVCVGLCILFSREFGGYTCVCVRGGYPWVLAGGSDREHAGED